MNPPNASLDQSTTDSCSCSNPVYEYLCKDCKKKLCVNCYQSHEEANSDHKVFKIDMENYDKSFIYQNQKISYEVKNR